MTAEPQVPEYRQYFNPALKALGGSASIEELTSRVVADMKEATREGAPPIDLIGGQQLVAVHPENPVVTPRRPRGEIRGGG